MRARILRFVDGLRAHELSISVAETMDALDAVAAAGIERPVLREALAATLVKDEHDRALFDELFDASFPLLAPADSTRRKRRGPRAGAGDPAGGRGAGAAAAGGRGGPASSEHPLVAAARASAGPSAEARGEAASGEHRARSARRRALMRRPLHALDPREVQEARALVRELGARLRGRLARRERRRRRGRLDVRRTLRAATTTGGVPLRLVRRRRRPDRADLVALVDLSGSVATASELCLGLVAPAGRFFRRVHLFAYVDRPCPITIEHGYLTPDGVLDLHARSDFGRVLEAMTTTHAALFTRRTLLLVVGDARNNRRPPRADLLRALRERVQRLVFLVPEPRARWNTGDSVLDRYAPACDLVAECETLGSLLSAVRTETSFRSEAPPRREWRVRWER
jgi:uncharacterized protein with von Willebrand factor type A (vWA) domain